MASASGDLGLRPSTVNLKSRSTGELTARDFQEYASPAFTPNGVVADGPQSVAGLSTITDTPSSAQGRIIRPPPFSRKLRKSLFIRPAETRGAAPGYLQSVKSALGYSWINVLLIFNPISWALYYSHQEDGAVFGTALLGIIPLAGMLGHGTETVALYTGDALGGLINASLGNATEFIIAILLLVKCEIRVVQASLLGGLLSNLLLVTGMAFIVGGIRFSEQEFRQTAAQLNTSLLTLAVIALVMPTAFAIALEQVAGPDQERDVVLQISRGSAVILIAIYISYMVFQLYSHTYLYNPENDPANESLRSSSSSSSSSRSSSSSSSPSRSPSPHRGRRYRRRKHKKVSSGSDADVEGPATNADAPPTHTEIPPVLVEAPTELPPQPRLPRAPRHRPSRAERWSAPNWQPAPRPPPPPPPPPRMPLRAALAQGVVRPIPQTAPRGRQTMSRSTTAQGSKGSRAAQARAQSTRNSITGSMLGFGSAAALGRGNQAPIGANDARVNEKKEELRMRPPGSDIEAQEEDHDKETPEMNLTVAICALVAATGLTYVTAEALTDSLEGIGRSGSVSTEWLGLILLAIVGNAAEHVTAVFVAYRNKVDLALAVSVGSCIQITLFVIPILVLIGWIINKPLSLLFDPLEVVTLFLSVLLVRFATEDGRTHYMSGVLLFGTYILIAFSFWYYPQNGTSFARLFECDA
ncbi:hypothetical protein K523DRAFT_273327 [Schizophyllum commune Tattone D]|nr:hypothetical protein K523DRAFT_273327 [Schizophyllum commune Tattone D]